MCLPHSSSSGTPLMMKTHPTAYAGGGYSFLWFLFFYPATRCCLGRKPMLAAERSSGVVLMIGVFSSLVQHNRITLLFQLIGVYVGYLSTSLMYANNCIFCKFSHSHFFSMVLLAWLRSLRWRLFFPAPYYTLRGSMIQLWICMSIRSSSRWWCMSKPVNQDRCLQVLLAWSAPVVDVMI